MQTQKTAPAYRRLIDFRHWLSAALVASTCTLAQAAPVIAPVSGEIQFITINNPADHWSGGTIVVGGTIVTIPRNLLIDLPANRLTLQQLFEQAPAACVAAGETGLAKGDTCNLTGMGGMVSLSANRTGSGRVIAGDVFIEKAVESVTGEITYINYDEGYFRVNGNAGDATTGVMVRLNDPDQRHTVQQGLGCATGSSNCSADPRFTLDGNNYTNVYTTGYPICIPSTVVRTFAADLINLGTLSANASADGTGDVLCPSTNRSTTPAGGATTGIVTDSRRFAPIQLGDHVVADGNFETVNGARFLSAHTTMVSVAMTTDTARLDQPDYFFFAEVFMEAPGFQNQRMRAMWIGFTTVSPADVMVWSLHYDPVTNAVHEFPLASTAGCDTAAGVGSCSGQNIRPGAWDIFRIRYDVDFGIGAKPLLDPCSHLQAEPRFGIASTSKICPNSPLLDPQGKFNTDVTGMMGIMQPVPHEIQGRTGRKMASLLPGGTPLVTVDIKGADATNGQYLFPFGMNLGGIEVAEMSEIDLGAFNTPLNFSGIPWNMDRRLSPGGCFGPTGCEATPQPLDPFPFEGVAMDPRLQAPPVAGLFSGLPQGPYTDPNFSASTLTRASNRVLSFVNPALTRQSTLGGAAASGNFDGDLTVFPWPPADPAALPVAVTPGSGALPPFSNSPPVAVADTATAVQGVPVVIAVLANDTDPNGDALSVTAVGAVAPATAGTVTNNGSNVTFNPNSTFTGLATFSYTISDGQGGTATAAVNVTVTPAANLPPAANADSASTAFATPVTIAVRANDTDPNGDALSVTAVGAVAPATAGTVTTNGSTVTFNPGSLFTGVATFTYTISDGRGGLATGNVTVTVGPPASLTVTLAEFRANGSEWRVTGTDSTIGATVTVRLGDDLTGPVIGTAVVDATGAWSVRVKNSPIVATATNNIISIRSSDGATRLGVIVTRR